ncbi:hypothetical protein L1887_04129 [Cichorium endivia]|nr:hypothetical protein L1887_04129 [Cichorium endivia]
MLKMVPSNCKCFNGCFYIDCLLAPTFSFLLFTGIPCEQNGGYRFMSNDIFMRNCIYMGACFMSIETIL